MNPGAIELLQQHNVDVQQLAWKLSCIIPNLISVPFNPYVRCVRMHSTGSGLVVVTGHVSLTIAAGAGSGP